MDLPNLLKQLKTPKVPPQQFLAIEIAPHAIKSCVWQVESRHTSVISIGSIESWFNDSDSDLIQAIDSSLSSALKKVATQPVKVIFGLSETWVGEHNIADNKKPLLKQICQKFNLQPVGFVVTLEAVVQYLREIEGGPPSAILLNVSQKEVAISLCHLGEIEGTQVVGRSTHLGADVEEGLARFPKHDTIPSRMILYEWTGPDDEYKQELISYDWQSKLPFLHFPKIETLSRDTSINAIAIAGGSEVAKSLGIPIKDLDEQYEHPKPVSPPPKKTSTPPPTPNDFATDFGFTTIEVNAPPPNKSTLSKTSRPPLESEPKANIPAPHAPPPHPETDEHDLELVPVKDAQFKPKSKTPAFKFPHISLPRFTRRSHVPSEKSASLLSKPSQKLKLRFPTLIITGLLLLALVIGGGYAYYWNVPTATVTILVSTRPIAKEITFTLDPTIKTSNFDTKTIPAHIETVEANGSSQTPTTGEKTVGERASGKVSIFNRTTSSKTFEAGTKITTGNLVFTLDDDVSIASASTTENSDFSVVTQPSKAEVAATAIDIGSQYNVSVDTEFSVSNLSEASFIAKAVTAFAGGSSRQIQAVSQDDVDLLTTELIKKLQDQTAQELTAKEDTQKGVIYASNSEILDQELSTKVGGEADTVSLTMSVSQKAYTYDLQDISLLAQQEMLESIPDGYILQSDQTQVEAIESKVLENDIATVTSKTTLTLIPMIDTQEVARNIQGKYPPVTQNYFKTLPNFVRTETTITPALPSRLNTFPHKLENITIEVKPVSAPPKPS